MHHILVRTHMIVPHPPHISRTHMLARVEKLDGEGGFLIQPYNGLGEPDGKAQVEDVENVHLLPEVGSAVRVNEKQEFVQEYKLASQLVSLGAKKRVAVENPVTATLEQPPKKKPKKAVPASEQPPVPASASAVEKKKKKKKKSVVAKKKKKSSPDATSALATAAATPPKKRKKKKNVSPKAAAKPAAKTPAAKTPAKEKQPLDRCSGETTSTAPELGEPSEFTLQSVLASFANPKGLFVSHICLSIYACSYMIVHI